MVNPALWLADVLANMYQFIDRELKSGVNQ